MQVFIAVITFLSDRLINASDAAKLTDFLFAIMSENGPLRFHNVHSKGIALSQDGTLARRTQDFGFVFSARPLQIDEQVTLKLMEVASKPLFTSAFCLGVTAKNPSDLVFEDLRNFTYLDLIKTVGYTALPIEKKLCTRNALMTFQLTSTGHLKGQISGNKFEKFVQKISPKTKMWGLIYFFENPVSIKLVNKGVEVTVTATPVNEEKKTPESPRELKTDIITVLKSDPGTPPTSTPLSECAICCEHEADAVLYKCAHMCVCYECAMDQWKGRGNGQCPVCRSVIEDVIKPYK